ncbi:MAG: zinc-binding dehydrogenase [Rhodocyclaceae bacterium]|nr:zinc-binding dehydrogenase [Rhodocyclaceae bacterium]
MKALICEAYGPIDTLVVKDLPSPVPGPRQLLVEVRAAAVNFPDALMVQGLKDCGHLQAGETLVVLGAAGGVGFAAGEIPKIPLNLALLKERSIVGVYWGDSVKHDPAGHLANLQQIHEWFAAGAIRPVVSECFPLAAAKDAIAKIANRQVKGKIVVLPDN